VRTVGLCRRTSAPVPCPDVAPDTWTRRRRRSLARRRRWWSRRPGWSHPALLSPDRQAHPHTSAAPAAAITNQHAWISFVQRSVSVGRWPSKPGWSVRSEFAGSACGSANNQRSLRLPLRSLACAARSVRSFVRWFARAKLPQRRRRRLAQFTLRALSRPIHSTMSQLTKTVKTSSTTVTPMSLLSAMNLESHSLYRSAFTDLLQRGQLGNNRSIDYEFVEVTPLIKLHCPITALSGWIFGRDRVRPSPAMPVSCENVRRRPNGRSRPAGVASAFCTHKHNTSNCPDWQARTRPDRSEHRTRKRVNSPSVRS